MSTPSIGLQVGLLLVAVSLGFGLAHWTAPPCLSEEALVRLDRMEALMRKQEAPLPASAPSPTHSAVGLDLSAVRADLRQLLREELHAAVSGAGGENPAKEREPAQPAPTSENLAAFEKARQLVDDGLASRRWGDTQRGEFSILRHQLTGPQYEELLRKLVLAINSQQLRIETSGPPF